MHHISNTTLLNCFFLHTHTIITIFTLFFFIFYLIQTHALIVVKRRNRMILKSFLVNCVRSSFILRNITLEIFTKHNLDNFLKKVRRMNCSCICIFVCMYVVVAWGMSSLNNRHSPRLFVFLLRVRLDADDFKT